MGNIGFLGAGNVAWHLSQEFEAANLVVGKVFSRDLRHAEGLCGRLYSAEPTSVPDFRGDDIDLVVISIPDDAVERILPQIQVDPGTAIVHTSGSLPMEILCASPAAFGVFYPLQTFSRHQKIDISEVPILVEASTKGLEKRLIKLGQCISDQVSCCSSTQRKGIHLAAVLACNFTNHLLYEAEKILTEQGLDLALLKPLVQQTVYKAFEHGPLPSQTGPAKRNDLQTMTKHLHLIQDQPDLQEVYRLCSKLIFEAAPNE